MMNISAVSQRKINALMDYLKLNMDGPQEAVSACLIAIKMIDMQEGNKNPQHKHIPFSEGIKQMAERLDSPIASPPSPGLLQ